MMPPRLVRLLGLGALAATGAFLALLALIVYASRPGDWAGLDWANRVVTWISLGGVFAALIAVHVVLGRRLLQLSRGGRFGL
jgi:hypothetical protein